MNQKKWMVIAGVVVVAVAVFLPGFLARRAQLEKLFTAMEALESSGAGALREQKLLEASQELDHMEQLSPGFKQSPVGSALVNALEMQQPRLEAKEFISDKENYLRFSEVEFDHPTEDDWNRFQELQKQGKQDESEFLYLLQPRTPAETIRAACQARAKGLLRNARILAGREKGELYVLPEPRKEHMWLDSLPVVHPARNR